MSPYGGLILEVVSKLFSTEALDSRGNPTLEVTMSLSNGVQGTALVPSGASTGASEALELRDGDPKRFQGQGVLRAVENVNTIIASEVVGYSLKDQESLDRKLIDLDGSSNKNKLGANAILGVSMAFAHAVANHKRQPLYLRFHDQGGFVLPVPMLNIINGGRHATNSIDFQEFMIVPAAFDNFKDSLRAGVEIYHSLKELLVSLKLSTSVGDEGGFAPDLSSNEQAIELIVDAIDKAGYVPGKQCFIALDVAASEFFVMEDGTYDLESEKSVYTPEELIDRYESWTSKYPIISIEDGMAEGDWDNWKSLTERIGRRVQLVGDDLLTTNTTLIQKGIDLDASNAVLIKPNQIGTITETLEAIKLAKASDWGVIISHRSGETEDTIIADLAVGTNAGQIKAGAPARSERTSKYNRLLRIEHELGYKAEFAGREIYDKYNS